MLEKEFDRLVKHRLTDHVSEVPGDMWTRIHAQEKQRRALFFWRYAGGGTLLVALLATIAVIHSTLPSPATSSTQASAPTTSAPPASVRPASASSTSTHPAAAATHPAPVSAQTLAATRESRAVAATHNIASSTRKHPTNPVQPTNTSITKPKSPVLTARITAVTTRTTSPTTRTTIPAARTTTPANLANIPAFANAITAHAPRTNPGTSTASIPKPKQKTQQPPRNWQLDIYGSPDYLFSEFRRGLSYTGGIRLTKVFHSGWNTTIGLQYSRFNLMPRKDSTKFTGTSYLKTLDLPVLAGYSWGNTRFRVGFNAGLIFNLHSWTEQLSQTAAAYPSSQYSLSSSPPPYSYRYQFNVGTSGYLGANFSGNLGHGFSLFTEPYLRHTLFGSKVKVYPGVSGITAAGLTIGLRRQF